MTDIEIDGDIQDDPLLNEQTEIYSILAGQLPISIFSSISSGMNMNELADRLVDFDDRWAEEGEFRMFEIQARDMINELEDNKLVQSEKNGWSLTNYGQRWRTQIDSADQTLHDLIGDNEIAASKFEAGDGQLVYQGEETIGDFYSALGFNVGVESNPEALPALYILAEGENNGFVPADYADGVEMLEAMGMVENTDYNGEELEPDITEVGQRVYDEIIVEDNEFLAEFYGFN